jgi:dynein light chain roadblock-type
VQTHTRCSSKCPTASRDAKAENRVDGKNGKSKRAQCERLRRDTVRSACAVPLVRAPPQLPAVLERPVHEHRGVRRMTEWTQGYLVKHARQPCEAHKQGTERTESARRVRLCPTRLQHAFLRAPNTAQQPWSALRRLLRPPIADHSTQSAPTISSPTAAASSGPAAPTAAPAGAGAAPMPAELERTLALLSAHRAVLGYLLLSRGSPGAIIRRAGAVFDGEQGRRYARAVGRIVDAVREGLEEVAADHGDAVRVVSNVVRPGTDLGLGRGQVHADTHEAARDHDIPRCVRAPGGARSTLTPAQTSGICSPFCKTRRHDT